MIMFLAKNDNFSLHLHLFIYTETVGNDDENVKKLKWSSK